MNKWIPAALIIAVSPMAYTSGLLHDYRIGNYEKAYKAINSKEGNNNKVAQFYLGMMQLHGYGTTVNHTKGIQSIKNSAERGYTKAQLFLGAYYLEKNEAEKSVHWFKRAADRGNMDAKMFVASAYIHGFGTKKNPGSAQRYIISAAKEGNALAQYTIGKQFIKSRHKKSQRLGLIWLKKAAKKGNVDAQLRLSLLYKEGKDINIANETAEKWFKEAMNKNPRKTAYQLANYFNQYDDEDAKLSAIKWYEKSAANNNPKATYKLGLLFLDKELNLYSPQKAFENISEAASKDYAPAQKKLAALYENGIGVVKDEEKSKYWLERAKDSQQTNVKKATLAWLDIANKGKNPYKPQGAFTYWQNKEALQNGVSNQGPKMSKMQSTEIFTPTLALTEPNSLHIYTLLDAIEPINPVKAPENYQFPTYPIKNKNPTPEEVKKLYAKAALGDSFAQFQLAQYFEQGIGLKKDPVQALLWYQKAAIQDHLPSEYNIAMLYLNAEGVEHNYPLAAHWLNKTAFKGNTRAQYVLALLHENGYGEKESNNYIAKDVPYAKSMYHLSAGNQLADAQLRLANLYAQNKGNKQESVAQKNKRHALTKELYEYAVTQGIKEAELPLAAYYISKKVPIEKQDWAYAVANEATNDNNKQAYFLLGLMYDRGIGVSQDRRYAASLYSKADNDDNTAVKFILGTYYYKGDGISKYQRKAIDYLNNAASKGFSDANYNLAVINYQNQEPFEEQIAKAANSGNSKANLFLADSALLNKDDTHGIQQAASIYQKLAEQGYRKAQLKLAYMYDKGIHFKKSDKEALSWYKKAAKQNNTLAQYQLGNMYQLGQGTKQNIYKAAYWYQKAAKHNYTKAQLALGFINETYLHNYAKALDWYEKAAYKGNSKAQYNLALMYRYGKGTKKDSGQSLSWYQKAASGGLLKAQLGLANIYNTSDNIIDKQEAFRWYLKAAKQQSPYAAYQVGLMYEAGVGTKINIPEAIKYYTQSMRNNKTPSKLALARLFEQGAGTNNNQNLAFKLYSGVAEKGNRYAKLQLAKLYMNGQGVEKNMQKGKNIIAQLAKKGYMPAMQIEASFKPKDETASLAKVVVQKPDTFNTKAYASPNLMYIDAIKKLNQGDYDNSKALLSTIMEKFPNYQPAQKTFKQITTIPGLQINNTELSLKETKEKIQ